MPKFLPCMKEIYKLIHPVYFFPVSLSFFFPFIFISWRLITLQYCSGFCHTSTWISHGFTCITIPIPSPAFLSIPSLWVFPVHQPWALVSNTCFNAVLSEHPTLAFSHRVQKSVLYICVSFPVLHIGFLPAFSEILTPCSSSSPRVCLLNRF